MYVTMKPKRATKKYSNTQIIEMLYWQLWVGVLGSGFLLICYYLEKEKNRDTQYLEIFSFLWVIVVLYKFIQYRNYKKNSNQIMDEQRAISILDKNRSVLYGAFTMIENTFPPREILNDFLLTGSDACDQDGKMAKWKPFSLSENSYSKVFDWWKEEYPQAKIESLGSTNWSEWLFELLERE